MGYRSNDNLDRRLFHRP